MMPLMVTVVYPRLALQDLTYRHPLGRLNNNA